MGYLPVILVLLLTLTLVAVVTILLMSDRIIPLHSRPTTENGWKAVGVKTPQIIEILKNQGFNPQTGKETLDQLGLAWTVAGQIKPKDVIKEKQYLQQLTTLQPQTNTQTWGNYLTRCLYDYRQKAGNLTENATDEKLIKIVKKYVHIQVQVSEELNNEVNINNINGFKLVEWANGEKNIIVTIWKNHLKRFGYLNEEVLEYVRTVLKIDAAVYANLTEQNYVNLGEYGKDMVGISSVFARNKEQIYSTQGPDLERAYQDGALVR